MKKLLTLVLSLAPALLFSQELTANAPTLEIMRLTTFRTRRN